MAPELSSNWNKLQERIAAESTRRQPADASTKRKASDEASYPTKRPRASVGTQKSDTAGQRSKPRTERLRMGAGQSSRIDQTSASGVSASLSLWTGDNDVTEEDIAEAYGLGEKDNSMLDAPDRVNGGLAETLDVGKYIAIDCEMVGIGNGGYESALARLSFVDYNGTQVYDSYVRPKERVMDWRTPVSGISPKHMRFARDFDEVQKQAAELLEGRILVGHDVRHDLAALELSHPASKIRDTSSFPPFRKYGSGRKPALRRLAQEILNVEIQTGAHSSIEDARVAMLLFRKFKPGFDAEYASRFPDSNQNQKPRKSNRKKKS